MTTLIAPCGLDCAKCEAYIHTQANDLAALEALADKWRVEYNAPNMSVKDVTCDGCLATSGRLGSNCYMCEIRQCAVEHAFTTCAQCNEYACEKLTKFFQMVPPARESLEAIRKTQ
jgi:hypothetical protein